MAEILLVRHTLVQVPQGICYGVTDVPLAGTFENELSILSKELESHTFSGVYSSPLSRCTQLAQKLTGSFTVDQRLSELNFGDWELMDWNTIYQTEAGKMWMENYTELSCPGGESYRDMQKRVLSFLGDIKSEITPLIITHAGVIRVLISILKKKPENECFSISVPFGKVISLTFHRDEG